MKKRILMASIVAFFGISAVGIGANADAAHPGTMGYDASKAEQKRPHQFMQMSSVQNNPFSNNFSITTAKPVYDISEWQGYITQAKAAQLKNEVPFVILRVQYGAGYQDKQIQHNIQMMQNNGIPYGVYSFSQYHNAGQAANEAQQMYNRAPNAAFYVNDYEDIKATASDSATNAWYNQIKSIDGGRKALFYSYNPFTMAHAAGSYRNYDGYWVAAYGPEPGNPHDLWQYTSSHRSNALGQKVDASISSHDPSWFSSLIQDSGTPQAQPTKHKKRHKKARRRSYKLTYHSRRWCRRHHTRFHSRRLIKKFNRTH